MNLFNIDISWPQLMGLHQLYIEKKTKIKLFSNPYLVRLKTEKRLLKYRDNNLQIIEATERFEEFYKSNFLMAYERYIDFFSRTGIVADGKRPYSMYDLETLIFIDDNKTILKANLTTERQFSAQLFKGSKYLENNHSVLKAVLTILEEMSFPKSDPKVQQWRLVIDCPHPAAIVLCENLTTLKQPDVARTLNIELWYVGGNNIKILEYLSDGKLQVPLYYMCDWDYDGLGIYSRVKKIIENKGVKVKLLKPYNLSMRLPVDSAYHNSNWQHNRPLSGLNGNDYENDDLQLINSLINANEWIEEESQDFKTIVEHNVVI